MNKRTLALACGLGLMFVAFGGDIENLWPEGKIPDLQPHQHSASTFDAQKPGFDASKRVMPRLEWYDAPASNKTDCCMILISGGAYECRCDGYWIDYCAKRLTAMGVQCVQLAYRTPRPRGLAIYQTAWEDGQRAVRLVRSEAAKRGFNPEKIGALGFSAGSHLTVLLATSSQTPAYAPVDEHDTTPCHINWAIPIYTAYALTDGLEGPNARLGDAIDVKLTDAFKFDAKTCPMCMFHGSVDIYSPNGSTQIYRQLRRMKIPAELHLFADRNHGFMGWPEATIKNPAGYDRWFDRAEEFIRQMQFVGPLAPEEDLFTRFPNDDARASCEHQDIWPEGAMPLASTNQCKPFIEWHLPKKLTTKAIQVIYSGGAYCGNSPDGHEVAPARRYLNEKGMAVVTLLYRCPRPQGLAKHTTAWQDLQRTIRLVRAGAEKRGLDPDRIGIWGSSAGGHLTLMGATSSRHQSYLPIDDIDKISCKVQWAVGIYPAYALTDNAENPSASCGNADTDRLVPEFSFDPDTCPMVFVHGDADVWPAMNSVKCWEQLRRMGIGCDLHTLALRNHCFMFKAAPGTGSYNYLDMVWQFLNAKGFNP